MSEQRIHIKISVAYSYRKDNYRQKEVIQKDTFLCWFGERREKNIKKIKSIKAALPLEQQAHVQS